jgi:hypothetical protein
MLMSGQLDVTPSTGGILKSFFLRFLDSSCDFNGQSFEYLPFGSGRRICPGIHMGSITVEIILSNLLHCFDWILPHGMQKEDINMEEKAGVSLAPSKKTPVILVPVNYLQ